MKYINFTAFETDFYCQINLINHHKFESINFTVTSKNLGFFPFIETYNDYLKSGNFLHKKGFCFTS